MGESPRGLKMSQNLWKILAMIIIRKIGFLVKKYEKYECSHQILSISCKMYECVKKICFFIKISVFFAHYVNVLRKSRCLLFTSHNTQTSGYVRLLLLDCISLIVPDSHFTFIVWYDVGRRYDGSSAFDVLCIFLTRSSCYTHPSVHVDKVGEEGQWPLIFLNFLSGYWKWSAKEVRKICRTSLVDMAINAKFVSRKDGVESGRRRSMTPDFFKFHIRILKEICWRSKKNL